MSSDNILIRFPYHIFKWNVRCYYLFSYNFDRLRLSHFFRDNPFNSNNLTGMNSDSLMVYLKGGGI